MRFSFSFAQLLAWKRSHRSSRYSRQKILAGGRPFSFFQVKKREHVRAVSGKAEADQHAFDVGERAEDEHDRKQVIGRASRQQQDYPDADADREDLGKL
jgi:hypothetical protein